MPAVAHPRPPDLLPPDPAEQPLADPPVPPQGAVTPLQRLTRDPRRAARVTHVHRVPARAAALADWPDWAAPELVAALRAAGVARPWRHQREAAELAWSGRSVVLSTGTASGKSLGYQLPGVSAVLARQATVLYVAPTKALAADQLRRLRALGLPALRAAAYDGDTPAEERAWARRHADLVLTNPDMLHHALLPGHAQWARFLRRLAYVAVDECHVYRGVFGSHVAHVLRRLRRLCAHYGAEPRFMLASATTAEPGRSARRLTGLDVAEVTRDGSPRGAVEFACWEPPLLDAPGENGAPVRRSATAESADLLADLVTEQVRTLAFVPSRKGAEAVALSARRLLAEVDPRLAERVAAYRAGFLPEERRSLEADLHRGALLGVAATNALELGVDVAGLDAVVVAGYPGSRASLWQQAGRAGRNGGDATAVLVARDDPLDTYLVHHPADLFGRPVEATVLDPDNPYVVAPHLCAAAQELPLTPADDELFGPAAPEVREELARRRLLRRRPAGWFWVGRGRASTLTDIRGSGGDAVALVEQDTGRLLGTVDRAVAPATAHAGAVYLHQGRTFLVEALDLDAGAAFARAADPGFTTTARDRTEIRIVDTVAQRRHPHACLSLGVVDVTTQVTSYVRRQLLTGEVIDEQPLDLPARTLRTRAVWWTVSPALTARAGVLPPDVPGAAHAAEHASIGLLPLVATCDRWDIGGVSTALHPDTGLTTVFVYDGHPGGAGFAERGFAAGSRWLAATRDAVRSCGCPSGCPSCVQSPKCGNGNLPLDKAGAARLLDALLDALGDDASPDGAA